MNQKIWALLFVCLLSCDYINMISASIHGRPRCCKKKRIVRETGGCRIKPEGLKVIEDCIVKIKNKMPDQVPFEDQEVDSSYQMHDGMISGLKNFKMTSIRCVCGRGLVRIFIRFSFLRILVTFLLSLLDNLLGGLLGTVGSTLVNVLGNVLNLLIRVLALDIVVQITIVQRFIPGTSCVVESYRVSRLVTIRLLGLDLAPVAELLSPILTPVLDLVFQLIFNGRVKQIFVEEFQKIIITKGMVTCS